MLLINGVPNHLNYEYFIKKVEKYGVLKTIGHKNSSIKSKNDFFILFSTKRMTNLVFSNKETIFNELLINFKCSLRKVDIKEYLDVDSYTLTQFKKDENCEEGIFKVVVVDQ